MDPAGRGGPASGLNAYGNPEALTASLNRQRQRLVDLGQTNGVAQGGRRGRVPPIGRDDDMPGSLGENWSHLVDLVVQPPRTVTFQTLKSPGNPQISGAF